MSADELHKAAETLRERASRAHCQCGGTACTPERGWFGPGEALVRLDSAAAANYVSVMTPAVGLALADWLEDIAAGWPWDGEEPGVLDLDGDRLAFEDSLDTHALTLARLINCGAE